MAPEENNMCKDKVLRTYDTLEEKQVIQFAQRTEEQESS